MIALSHFLFRERHPGVMIRTTGGAWDARGFGGYRLFRIIRPIDRALTLPLRFLIGALQSFAVRRMRRRFPRLA